VLNQNYVHSDFSPFYPQGFAATAFIYNSRYAVKKCNLYHYSLLLLLFLSPRLVI